MRSSPAELVFTGGPVRTGDGWTTAVAVTGGRVSALGDDVAAQRGPRTEVIDLRGRLLLPGFQDAHVHAVGGGYELGRCHLSEVDTLAEYTRLVAEYARRNPDAAWITGGGWSLEAFPGGIPAAGQLDAVVADRPVFLVNRDHHGAWVNSRALELAGITRHTPDPPDGRIERDHDGEPNGTLQEGAVALVARLLPEPTGEEILAGLLRAQELLHSLGITAWQDALLGRYAGMPDPSEAYLAAAATGKLTARVSGALWWDRDRGAEQIEELVAKRERFRHPRLKARTVKIMQDGIAENHTAAMLDPYLGGCGCSGSGGHRGISFVDPRALGAYVSTLDKLDFQVHFHALGDRAVRESLDAVEAARKANGDRGNRHHLAHLQVVHPDDVPRFAALGAVANIQPLWAAHEPQLDELTIPFLGTERAGRQYPFAALLAAGARLAAGSDWPVTSPDPVQGIHVAVNRVSPGADAEVFLPEQRIELGTAIDAYTSGSAYVNHADDTGRIRPGNPADLVVLDRNPFDGPVSAIADTRVAMTFVAGQRVHTANNA
ncbi:amidohydrolase [Amycolatopsis samaneae]|uniref:Amidohydrolase n=1 Tax=Amycolatopsis samaneae TaxID=664691 RepID=A0ABW5GLJ2_9PSEU